MKEKELRKHTDCAICKKKIGASGLPLFWTMRIQRHGLLAEVIKRQDGLAAVLGGNSMLAQVMGTDEEMTQTMFGPVTITVCEDCACRKQLCLAMIAEGLPDEEGNKE